ncbi:MAG: class I mannose-6-phosphate isomerase [Allosphingosinicella sp.]|uniref:class I mannose-6-phosphate isomerase n=1 Tax=Allosphingosinicella sp. TaxID=2823234 RepID=UPI00393B7C6D
MRRMLSPLRWEDRPDLATRLSPRAVARPWGRAVLPHVFADFAHAGERIGEVWHEEQDASACRLLVKHLFTADLLSIQVHPDSRQAAVRGLPCGKDEAWFVLNAEPGAVIGLGLRQGIEAGKLRDAALDGSIEQLIDWRPVAAGDVLACPGGTIHAIGGGISLIEVQQNLDLTYRLYDYGRPRELHLDDAVDVAIRGPAPISPSPRCVGEGRELLLEGGSFVLERWRLSAPAAIDGSATELLLIPLATAGRLDGAPLGSGEVWRVPAVSSLEPGEGADLLVAYTGSDLKPDLLR